MLYMYQAKNIKEIQEKYLEYLLAQGRDLEEAIIASDNLENEKVKDVLGMVNMELGMVAMF